MKRRSITLAIAAVTAVAMVAPQVAEAQRYKRESLIRSVNVKQTEKTKKLKPKPKKARQQPEITADEFIELQGKVRNIREEQAREYELLIEDTDPDDPELPDLLFRLAEIHAQQQRNWRFRAMEGYAKIEAAKGQKAKAKLKRQQKTHFDNAKKALLASVKAYKRVADNPRFRNFPRMDEALFYYAYTLQSAKYAKEARKVFHRLIKDYPESQYIPEAYLAFADYYFAQNSLANAEQFYNKVLKFPKSRVYNFALYKKGWVHLNLDQPQEALETFFQVVQKTRGKKRYDNLNRAAKKDFVRAYAEVGKPQRAYQAFQRVDRGYAFDMLQILGDIYLEQGKAVKGIFTFRELIGLRPKHKMVCDWQYNVVHAMLSVGNRSQKVKEIENLVKLYVRYKDKDILPESNLSECFDNAEAVNNEIAKIWHNEAMKTLDFETLAYVDQLYQLYLNSFPQSPEHAEMQYYYAELMWQRAENEKNERKATDLWEQAAIAFTDVVKTGKLKGKLLKEAAYAAVLGWKNALAVDPSTKAPPVAVEEGDKKMPPPQDIPQRQQKMIEAFDIYISYVKDPKDDELVMMKFLKARIYWRYNHYDKAIPLFEDIVEKHLNHETGAYSVNLLLDTLILSKKYEKMSQWVDILLKKKRFLEDREDLAIRLEKLKQTSLRKVAEQLETQAKDSGDFTKYVDCGKAYIEIFNRNPEAEDADAVLYNAGVCFEQGKSIGVAITMFQQLSKLFPDSVHTQRAIARLGNNYTQIAWYRRAAERFEEYARRFGGEKDAYEALSDAVFYRKGIGDDKQAIENTQFFIKQYGRKKVKEAASAMFSMTSIFEKANNDDDVISHLRRYLKQYGKRGGIDRQIVAHAKMGMILWRQSCPVSGVDGGCIRVRRERSIVSRRKAKRRSRVELPKQCGPESKIKLTVVDRDFRKANAAKKEFKKAIKLFNKGRSIRKVPGKGSEKAERTAHMIYHYAAAQFYLAEEQYEAFLDIKFPKGLDFDPRKRGKQKKSLKRFKEWLKEKSKQGAKASKMYVAVKDIKGGGAHFAIASAARVGQVSQNFSDALFTAEVPKNVRSGQFAEDKVDAYCDELTTQAEPLEKKSVQAFGFCLGLSTQLNWFNSWSRLCEKELGQIRPQEFPTAAELRGVPNNLAPVLSTEPAIWKLE